MFFRLSCACRFVSNLGIRSPSYLTTLALLLPLPCPWLVTLLITYLLITRISSSLKFCELVNSYVLATVGREYLQKVADCCLSSFCVSLVFCLNLWILFPGVHLLANSYVLAFLCREYFRKVVCELGFLFESVDSPSKFFGTKIFVRIWGFFKFLSFLLWNILDFTLSLNLSICHLLNEVCEFDSLLTLYLFLIWICTVGSRYYCPIRAVTHAL